LIFHVRFKETWVRFQSPDSFSVHLCENERLKAECEVTFGQVQRLQPLHPTVYPIHMLQWSSQSSSAGWAHVHWGNCDLYTELVMLLDNW
jgi:hypothetical protein